jgi:CHAT domain-containing protein/tetratricopeptide (TPR) repeat protein
VVLCAVSLGFTARAQTPAKPELLAALEKADSAGKQAIEHSKAGRREEAKASIAAAVAALAGLESAKDEQRAADVLARLAKDAERLGNPAAARSAWQAVVAQREKALPADHADLLYAEKSLALVLQGFGDFQGARALDEKVVAVLSRTRADDDQELVWARTNLAQTSAMLGDFASAIALQEKVLAAVQKKLGADHEDVQSARVNLAISLKQVGELERARALEEAAVAALAEAKPDDDPDLQWARGRLAETLDGLGDLERALDLRQKTFEVLSRSVLEDHESLQLARIGLGNTLRKLGDFPAARALQERALSVWARSLPAVHPYVRFAQSGLAGTLIAAGDLEGGRALLEKVLASVEGSQPPASRDVQMSRVNLAAVLSRLGQHEAARALLEKAVGLWTQALPSDHGDLQSARLNLAGTLLKLGDPQRARALEEQVIEVYARTLPLEDLRRRTAYSTHAETVLVLDDGEAACGSLLQLARGLAGQFDALGPDLSPRQLEEMAIGSRRQVADLLRLSASGKQEKPLPCQVDLDLAGFKVVQAMRGVGVHHARLLRLARRSPADTEVARRLAASREARARLGALAQRSRRATLGAAERESVVQATLDRDQAEARLRQRLETLAGSSLPPRLLDPRAVARALPEDAVAVGYWTYAAPEAPEKPAGAPQKPADSRPAELLLAHVVDRSGRLQRVDLGPLEPIERAVEAWREALAPASGRGLSRPRRPAAAPPAEVERLGAELRRRVFDPLRAAIGDARRVVVALDGPLHLVPLDALPEGAGLLGERFAIELRTSLDDLAPAPTASGVPRTLFAVGGVDYGGAPEAAGAKLALRGRAESFGALEHTAGEVAAVRGLLPAEDAGGAVVLTGADASKEAFLVRAPGARYLHLATHGYFAPESAASRLESAAAAGGASGVDEIYGLAPSSLAGLAFAGANLARGAASGGGGVLTAEELAGLDLSTCELATLSACETSAGVRRAGQGLASLQKSLAMAGVRASLTSLWSVSDEATRELMEEFYRRLWTLGMAKERALWEAKMALRGRKQPDGSPRYPLAAWAGWVLVGEQR